VGGYRAVGRVVCGTDSNACGGMPRYLGLCVTTRGPSPDYPTLAALIAAIKSAPVFRRMNDNEIAAAVRRMPLAQMLARGTGSEGRTTGSEGRTTGKPPEVKVGPPEA
jgi:hypothetical protein